MRYWIAFLGLFSLAAPALCADNQVLFPGQSALVGGTVVECRGSGTVGPITATACSDNGLLAARALCNEFSTWAGTDNCLAALRDATYFDKKVVTLCRSYSTWDGALDCVSAARNRYYDATEVKGCHDRPTWASATSCLQATGTRVFCQP